MKEERRGLAWGIDCRADREIKGGGGQEYEVIYLDCHQGIQLMVSTAVPVQQGQQQRIDQGLRGGRNETQTNQQRG